MACSFFPLFRLKLGDVLQKEKAVDLICGRIGSKKAYVQDANASVCG